MSGRRTSMGNSAEDPPNSRLFVVSSKTLNEEDFHEAFVKFGSIDELWMVKDKQTGENKGVTYIKFSKTSEAALAMEEMNGRCIGNSPRALKVMIASSRDKGSQRDQNEEEKTLRLFVVVPKNMTNSELYDHFKQFGEIDYANIVSDKNTGESKGVAYVKYFKFSSAAKAFESCDRKYRAVFAEPRRPNIHRNEEKSFNFNDFSTISRSLNIPSVDMSNDENYYALNVITNHMVTQDQLWKLFDIVPGMDYCELKVDHRSGRGFATVVYTESRWAAHAKDKIHGFEYPPGFRLIVKPDYKIGAPSSSGSSRGLPDKQKAELLQLAETIAHASSLIQAAGLSPDLLSKAKGKEGTDCSVKLPDAMPMAHPDADVAARCFIVCTPTPLPPAILKDVFCRFGSLIDVYMLNNRNCGYAKYGDPDSAECARKTLHGAEVNGIRLKVIEAEERPESRKRPKLDDSAY